MAECCDLHCSTCGAPMPSGLTCPGCVARAVARRVHAKRVHTIAFNDLDIETLIREEMRLAYCATVGILMDFVDKRPWVRTHDQDHPVAFWGNGIEGGCGHPDCDDTAGRNLTGLMNKRGIEMFQR